MNAALAKNQTELGILILAVAVKMLADGDGLLDQVVQILWNIRCQAVALQDSEDLCASHCVDLGNSKTIPESDTDLGWCESLLSQFADVVSHIIWLHLQPGWWTA